MNFKARIPFKAAFSLLTLFLLSFQLSGQGVVKGSGIRYYDGYTIATYRNAIAPETSVGTEFAYFIDLNIVCKWDRTNSIWVPVNNILSQSGVPAHTPNTGEPLTYLDKDTGLLYKYSGGAWALSGIDTFLGLTDTPSTIGQDSVLMGDGDSLVFAPRLPSQASRLYVDENGNDTTAIKGRIDKPWRNPYVAALAASKGDEIIVNSGSYPIDSSRNIAVNKIKRFTWSGTLNYDRDAGSSQETFFINMNTTTEDTLYVTGDEIIFNDRGDRMFNVYGDSAYLNFHARKVIYSDNAVTEASFGDLGRIFTSADIVIDRLYNLPEAGFFIGRGESKMNVNLKFGIIEQKALSPHLQKRMFMVEPTGTEGVDNNVNIEVGVFQRDKNANTKTESGFDFALTTFEGSGSNVHSGVKNVKFGAVSIDTSQVDGNIGGSLGFASSRIQIAVAHRNSFINYEIGSLDGDMTTSMDSTTDIDSSDFNWNLGTINTTKRIIDFYDGSMANESNFRLNCGSCIVENDVAFSNTGTTVDASSRVSLSGYYETKEPGYPVIWTESDLYLQNVILKNDGTVAAIQSDVPVTVYVAGAFDQNTIISDPDVTIVRLDEYGASGGGGAGGDSLWNHLAKQNINLDSFWLSPDGTSQGVKFDPTGGLIYQSLVSGNYRLRAKVLGNTTAEIGLFDDSFLDTRIQFIKDASDPHLDFGFNAISNYRFYKDYWAIIPSVTSPSPTLGDSYFYIYPKRSGAAGSGGLYIRDGTTGVEKQVATVDQIGGDAATDISVTPSGNLTSTDVQAALEEQQFEVDLIPRKYDNIDFIDRFEKTGVLSDDSIYFQYADDLINVIYRVDDSTGILFEMDQPDDFFRLNDVQIVQPEHMANADSTAGTFTGYPGSSAYGAEGAELFHDFEGTGILFNHFSDNRGGIWRFYLSQNNTVIDSVDVDTYVAGVSGRQKTLFTNLDYGSYSVRGINTADYNPSSTGDNRGWVSAYTSGNVIYRLYYTFVIEGWEKINTYSVKEEIKATSSVLEFAFSCTPTGSGQSQEWIPYHGTNSVFYIGDSLEIYKDGIEVVQDPINSLYTRARKIIVKQEAKGMHTSQSDSLMTFKYNHSFVQNKIDMIAEFVWADTVDVTGYGFMFPIANTWGDTLTTDQNQKVGLDLTDGSTTTLTPTYGTIKSCLAESLSSDFLFTAAIKDDYTLRSQDLIPLQFVEHRSTGLIQKWYNQTYFNHTAYPGEKYFSSTSVSVWKR